MYFLFKVLKFKKTLFNRPELKNIETELYKQKKTKKKLFSRKNNQNNSSLILINSLTFLLNK